MKKYFLSFDFYGDGFHKFWYGVVEMNLSNDKLIDVCKRIINDSCDEIDAEKSTIKVTALNNIEI